MWPNPQETADMVIFTEEILNIKQLLVLSKVGPNLIQSFFYALTKYLLQLIQYHKSGKITIPCKSNEIFIQISA